MSEKLTRIRLQHRKNAVWMDWGEHTRADMLRQIRAKAQHDFDEALAILNADDVEFEVTIIRGSIVQHPIRTLVHGEDE